MRLTHSHSVHPKAVKASVVVLGAMLCTSTALGNDWNTRWQQEWAGDREGAQKMETRLSAEWNHSLSPAIDLTAIGRLHMDTQDELGNSIQRPANYSGASAPLAKGTHGQLELRELYIDAEWFDAYWRLGKQQVVWGQADGLKVLDVVTPQSYREFILDDFDDSRIALWMINVEVPLSDNSTLQWIWIPDTTYHEMAGSESPYAITSPLRVPTPPPYPPLSGVSLQEVDKPSHWLNDSDTGLRYRLFWQGWDLTANYFYHYRDFFVPYQTLNQQQLSVAPEYERSHLLGGTASNAFGDFTLRAELGWFSDSYHIAQLDVSDSNDQGIHHSEEVSSVIGLDWQGLTDIFISVQWFQSFLPDHDHTVVRDRSEQSASLLIERQLANETWTLKLQGLYSLNRGDQLWRPKVSYLIHSNIELWAGADIFSGDRTGLYGQFKNANRFTLGFEWGF